MAKNVAFCHIIMAKNVAFCHNKQRSFELFMCLDLVLERQQSSLFQTFFFFFFFFFLFFLRKNERTKERKNDISGSRWSMRGYIF